MKKVLYKKRQSLKHRRKVIAMHEFCEDQDCRTHVRKSFVYIVTSAHHGESPVESPQVYVRKFYDTKLHHEKFSFRVKGAFYMTKDRAIFRVDFCHTLKIDIHWKNKIFSPKKSVTLT